MSLLLNARLSLMMFLNYVIWGAWYVTLGTYLTAGLKFSGTEAGTIFGATALACMISPFFVGLIADRYFSTERMLAALHLVGALLLYGVTRVSSFGAVYAMILIYSICYFPTISLDHLAHFCASSSNATSRVSPDPRLRHHRLDRDRADRRGPGSRSHLHSVSACRRRIAPDESLLSHPPAHPAWR